MARCLPACLPPSTSTSISFCSAFPRRLCMGRRLCAYRARMWHGLLATSVGSLLHALERRGQQSASNGRSAAPTANFFFSVQFVLIFPCSVYLFLCLRTPSPSRRSDVLLAAVPLQERLQDAAGAGAPMG